MFRHTSRLQFESKPDKPDPVYAHKLQELIGGAYGEMTVTMQYLFQGWNCRMPGKYKDLIMDIATEEIGHVEMIATMVVRLLEGAPATATTKAAADPVVGAVLGGMDPQQAIVAGGGALPADSNGYPWNGRYIVASGNLLADLPRQRRRRGPGTAADRPAVQHDRRQRGTRHAQVQPGPRHSAPEPVAQGDRGAAGRWAGDRRGTERAVR
jgi:hypothetical protein